MRKCTTKTKNSTNNNLTKIASSNINVDNDLTITSNNDVTVQSSNLRSGLADQDNTNPSITGNLAINAKNLNIVADSTSNLTTTNIKVGKTLRNKFNNSGSFSTDYVNSNLTAKNDNFSFNITDKVNIAGKGVNDNNSQQQAYIKAIEQQLTGNNNSNNPVINRTNLAYNNKDWNDTTRALTDVGTAVVAIGAVAATILTAGAAGAAVGAAATTATAGASATAAGAAAGAAATAAGATAAAASAAATAATVAAAGGFATAVGAAASAATMATLSAVASTAAVSATQAGMNVDGDIFKQIKDTSKQTWDATTSRDAIESYAIAAVIAGVSAGVLELSGGSTSLESGSDAVYKPNKDLIKAYPERFADYNGVIDPSANNIGLANTTDILSEVGQPVPNYSNNPFTKSFWQGIPKEGGFISNNANKVGGMNAMSTMHDPWSSTTIVKSTPLATQITIAPAIVVQYCATFPAICGAVSSEMVNDNFGVKQ